jgi:methionyl-tRNA formyltransferase
MLITASFGQIVPKSILNQFLNLRRLNVHPSLLPVLRGPAPIQHSIAEAHHITGISILGIEPYADGIDSGHLWEQRHVVRMHLLNGNHMFDI